MNRRFIHENVPTTLEEALSESLPGQRAQFQMAPVHRRNETSSSVEDRSCREAAVLALLYPGTGATKGEKPESNLLLTVRPDVMPEHAGQVALPGGSREKDESLRDTALRETEEEVHISRSDIRILGRLSPLFVTPTNYCVYPFLGWMDCRPDMSVTSDEVARMFGAPLAELVDPDTRKTAVRNLRGTDHVIPYFDLAGHFVWGATAMMLSELAAILNPSLLDSDPLTSVDD